MEKETKSYHSIADICRVRWYLSHLVPPEIAEIIVDCAEYWAGQSSQRNRLSLISAGWASDNNCSAYYLITKPIQKIHVNGQIQRTKLRRVQFTLTSCDQGWGGNRETHGTYKDSWTWFETSIIRPGYIPTKKSYKSKSCATFDRIAFDPPYAMEFHNPRQESGRWFLQRNIQVSSEKKKHIISWNYDDQNFPDRKQPFGTGDGTGFLELLEPDHRIGIVARAQYPGWVNNVVAAEVEVFFTF